MSKSKLFGLVVLGAGVLAGVFLLSNRVLITRYYTQSEPNQVNGYTWYQPTEDIPGDHDGFFEVVPEAQRTISADAIATASAYAQLNNSESLLIWHRGALQHAEYWYGLGPRDVVNSRSMHKMAGGLLIAWAIAEGYIESVDDPVTKYIAAWRGTEKDKIKIRDVLHMSSGLRWFSIRDPAIFGLSTRRYLSPTWDKVLLEEMPMSFEPGTEWDYSDITADVMPHIVEGATGKRYAQYFSEALVKPLGAEGGFVWVNREGGMPHGGCCLMLPPETWLRFGLLLLNGGAWDGVRLLPDGWIDAMLAPFEEKPQFGFMIWLGQPYLERRLIHRPESPINQVAKPGVYHSEPFLADDLFMIDGAEGRMVYIVPSEDLVIVRTGFRPSPGEPEWDNAFLPNAVIRGILDEDEVIP